MDKTRKNDNQNQSKRSEIIEETLQSPRTYLETEEYKMPPPNKTKDVAVAWQSLKDR